jgi:hypothetical protein
MQYVITSLESNQNLVYQQMVYKINEFTMEKKLNNEIIS